MGIRYSEDDKNLINDIYSTGREPVEVPPNSPNALTKPRGTS